MAKWLVCWTLDQTVQVKNSARVIVLGSEQGVAREIQCTSNCFLLQTLTTDWLL